MSELEHLVDLEREGWEALSSGRGGAYYREHLTEDALMAFPVGIRRREETIAAIESAPPWSPMRLRSRV